MPQRDARFSSFRSISNCSQNSCYEKWPSQKKNSTAFECKKASKWDRERKNGSERKTFPVGLVVLERMTCRWCSPGCFITVSVPLLYTHTHTRRSLTHWQSTISNRACSYTFIALGFSVVTKKPPLLFTSGSASLGFLGFISFFLFFIQFFLLVAVWVYVQLSVRRNTTIPLWIPYGVWGGGGVPGRDHICGQKKMYIRKAKEERKKYKKKGIPPMFFFFFTMCVYVCVCVCLVQTHMTQKVRSKGGRRTLNSLLTSSAFFVYC